MTKEFIYFLFGVALLIFIFIIQIKRDKAKKLRIIQDLKSANPEIKMTKSANNSVEKKVNDLDNITPQLIFSVESRDTSRSITFKMEKHNCAVFIPDSSIPLHLDDCDKSSAQQILDAFTNKWGIEAKTHIIYPIMAANNITCREIEEYIKEFTPKYTQCLTQIFKDEMDAEEEIVLPEIHKIQDNMKEFAVKKLDYRPTVQNLFYLFDSRPPTITWDDELIKKYSYKALRVYFRVYQSSGINDVYFAPVGEYERKYLDQLVEMELAVRGKAINIRHYLQTLRVVDLTEKFPEIKKGKTKAELIDSIISNFPESELRSRTKGLFAYRSTFQLKELPDMDTYTAYRYWKYMEIYISVFLWTLIGYTRNDPDYIRNLSKKSKVKVTCDYFTEQCNYAVKSSKEFHNPRTAPIPPYHVGCTCELREV